MLHNEQWQQGHELQSRLINVRLTPLFAGGIGKLLLKAFVVGYWRFCH